MPDDLNGPMTGYQRYLPDVIKAKAKEVEVKTRLDSINSVHTHTEKRWQHQLDSVKLENQKLEILAKVPKADRKEVRNICDNINESVEGIGTKNIEFEKALDNITKSNIIEVMDQWEQTYGKNYNETLIESVFNDADHRQKNVWGEHMVNALEERAGNHGKDITTLSNDVRTELNSYNINTRVINDNIEKIRGQLKDTEY